MSADLKIGALVFVFIEETNFRNTNSTILCIKAKLGGRGSVCPHPSSVESGCPCLSPSFLGTSLPGTQGCLCGTDFLLYHALKQALCFIRPSHKWGTLPHEGHCLKLFQCFHFLSQGPTWELTHFTMIYPWFSHLLIEGNDWGYGFLAEGPPLTFRSHFSTTG